MVNPATKELEEFIDRCVTDIEDNPESMNAGLANALLQQIVSRSVLTQKFVFDQISLFERLAVHKLGNCSFKH